MTECERLISEGIISSEFLKKEVRCEFFVDEKRKKIWAIEIDLLNKFDSVCRKYGLKYYLIYGSLLGAIRHNGFIPWDDDVDVCMPRKDREKLIEVAKNEFSEPYFLQTPYSDPGSCFSMIKLRNRNTTAVTSSFRYEKFTQGICIDIFTLDNCVIESQCEHYNKIKELTQECSACMRKNNLDLTARDKEIIEKHEKGRDGIEIYEELQMLAQKYNNIETKYATTSDITVYSWEKELFYWEDFEQVVEWDFEGIKVPVPQGYDRILTTTYGDYRKFPPVEDRGNWHNYAIFDPDKPYCEYLL